MAIIIDGKAISRDIKEQIKKEVEALKNKYGKTPCLSVVLIGDDPASAVYVKNKKIACAEVGMESREYLYPASISQKEVLSLITELNRDPKINGILVQAPLPGHLNNNEILELIDYRKDVDCFHPFNVGKVVANDFSLAPCTPAGIVELLDRSKVEISGKRVVVIGRSNIVGKPMALLLLHRNATVTICHSKTFELNKVCQEADILIAAIGRANFVTEDFVKPGAVVVDVGMNRYEGKLVGDVDFAAASQKASYITPVPGGVGPMTIAMLMKNTLIAFKEQNSYGN